MADRRYLAVGLALFLLAVSYPAWRAITLGTAASRPQLARAGRTPCVLPVAEMRTSHMRLLAEWRDLAVRGGVRRVTMKDGRSWKVRVSATCLECHDKARFCDTCHAYAAVTPECWSCHVVTGPPPAGAPGASGVQAGAAAG